MDLFRDPGTCSKGLTHSILAVLLQECAGAGRSEMGAEVLLESFSCLLECSLSFCPLAAGEPKVGALFLVVGSLKSPFTGSQSAINEATMWLVTVGTYLAVSQVRFRSDWGGYQKGWAGWFLRQSLSG